MGELKELLEYAEIRKEKLIEEYYGYIMECDRNKKDICHFTLGRMQGKIDEQKEMIKVINQIIKENKPKKKYTRQDFQDVFDFLSRISENKTIVIGIELEEDKSKNSLEEIATKLYSMCEDMDYQDYAEQKETEIYELATELRKVKEFGCDTLLKALEQIAEMEE
jgi:hypothetical protein